MSAAGVTVVLGVGIVLVFGLVTLVALEGREVVTLVTRDASGASRATRTWVVDDGDGILVEAAHAERPFFRHLLVHPEVEMRGGGRAAHCRAVALPNPDGHARVRQLLAEKYGWADRWVGLLTDTSASIAVRLTCR
jgi:hypothetical protein